MNNSGSRKNMDMHRKKEIFLLAKHDKIQNFHIIQENDKCIFEFEKNLQLLHSIFPTFASYYQAFKNV